MSIDTGFIPAHASGDDFVPDPSVLPLENGAEFFGDGTWTRLAGHTLADDPVVEDFLSRLAVEVEQRARAQGYAAGWAEGRRDADVLAETERLHRAEQALVQEARRDREHGEGLNVLAGAAQALRDAVTEVCDSVAAQATQISCALTEALIGHELSLLENPGIEALQHALALAPDKPLIRIRLSPAEAEKAAALTPNLAAKIAGDPSLGPADVMLDFDDSVLDHRISGAVSRALEVLRRDAA